MEEKIVLPEAELPRKNLYCTVENNIYVRNLLRTTLQCLEHKRRVAAATALNINNCILTPACTLIWPWASPCLSRKWPVATTKEVQSLPTPSRCNYSEWERLAYHHCPPMVCQTGSQRQIVSGTRSHLHQTREVQTATWQNRTVESQFKVL